MWVHTCSHWWWAGDVSVMMLWSDFDCHPAGLCRTTAEEMSSKARTCQHLSAHWPTSHHSPLYANLVYKWSLFTPGIFKDLSLYSQTAFVWVICSDVGGGRRTQLIFAHSQEHTRNLHLCRMMIWPPTKWIFCVTWMRIVRLLTEKYNS